MCGFLTQEQHHEVAPCFDLNSNILLLESEVLGVDLDVNWGLMVQKNMESVGVYFYTRLQRLPSVEKHFVVSNRFMALLTSRLNIAPATGLVRQSDYSS